MNPITTPVYIKTDEKMEWPKDKFFYLVAQEGLFKCRNHEFFESCVKVETGPSELASQHNFVRLSYPKLPQVLIERAVGFFHLIAKKQNSEAAALFVWNRQSGQVELLIPDQIGINGSPSQWSPKGYPLDVKYKIPKDLPGHLMLIGDIHCHVDGGAYASGTDEFDEKHRAGIHIVVGHIYTEPPDFFCEVVADGQRFEAKDMKLVWEGYEKRRANEVPQEWIDKVKLQEKKYSTTYDGGMGYTGGMGHTVSHDYGAGESDWKKEHSRKEKEDRKAVREILCKWAKSGHCPTMTELRQELIKATKVIPILDLEDRAKKFINAWKKVKHEKAA